MHEQDALQPLFFWYLFITVGKVIAATTPIIPNVISTSAKVKAFLQRHAASRKPCPLQTEGRPPPPKLPLYLRFQPYQPLKIPYLHLILAYIL